MMNMPDWFKHPIIDVIIFCSLYVHFGNAWSKNTDNNIYVLSEFEFKKLTKEDAVLVYLEQKI